MPCRFTVTYPTEYKRLRTAFPRPALRAAHATLRSNEGLAMGHRLPNRFILNADLIVLADCASACAWCRFSSEANSALSTAASVRCSSTDMSPADDIRLLYAVAHLIVGRTLTGGGRPLEGTYLLSCSRTDGRARLNPLAASSRRHLSWRRRCRRRRPRWWGSRQTGLYPLRRPCPLAPRCPSPPHYPSRQGRWSRPTPSPTP